jgi:transcriptional regulator of arginine metabolism
MTAQARHALIRRLLAERPVHSQEELRRRLERAGSAVTQATLSRDLRTLGAYKTPEGYRINGRPAPGGARRDTFEAGVRAYAAHAAAASNLLVLKTEPGHADPLALAIDHAGLPTALGCIAGDDTVFVATTTPAAAAALAKRCKALIGATA